MREGAGAPAASRGARGRGASGRAAGVLLIVAAALAGCGLGPPRSEPITTPAEVPHPRIVMRHPPPFDPSAPAVSMPPDSVIAPWEEPVGFETGLASFYGRRFHGRRTASGELFDMNDATAAHPTLPFGTRIRVTNLDTGRSLVVRINDRGPHVRGRIIDLSLHAAQQLGFVRQGLARVRIEPAR